MIRVSALVLLLAAALTAQNGPSFDVASIRSNPGGKQPTAMDFTKNSMSLSGVSLRAMLATAYEVQEYRVAGPSWLDSQRFDVLAKTENPATPEEMHKMMQALLAERFKVTIHREQKELPVLALVVGKGGPKFEKAEGDGPAAGMQMNFKKGAFSFPRTSLESFAGYLSKFPAFGRPVVDRTQLAGLYNINLVIAEPGASPEMVKKSLANFSEGPGILGAVEALGLKLDSQKANVEVIVVDHAEKMPTEN